MQFKTGWLGACLVVIALLATVLLGFTLNINEGTEAVLKYEPITNVTGQFEGDRVPEYIEYNGAKNYTGYTPASINFTPSHVANQYTVITNPGTTTTLYNGLIASHDTGHVDINSRTDFIGVSGGLWATTGAQLSVNQLLTNLNINFSAYDYLKIDLMGGVAPWQAVNQGYTDYYFTNNAVTAGTVPVSDFNTFWSHPPDDYSTSYMRYRLTSINAPYLSYPSFKYSSALEYIPYSTDSGNMASYLIIYPNGTVNYYRSGTGIYANDGSVITQTDALIFSSDVGHSYVNYFGLVGTLIQTAGTPAFPMDLTTYEPLRNYRNEMNDTYADPSLNRYYTDYVTITGVQNTVYDYMRISDGVTLTGPSVWANDKTNGVIDWVIKFNTGDTFDITPAWGTDTYGTVALSYNGDLIASVAGQAYNGGGWDTWHISIDGLNGSVALTPVTSFNTFQNYTLSASPKVFNVPAFAHGGITSVNLSATGTPNFSVTRTTVNYDISKTSVLNGSMNPRQYFPSADYGQLKIMFDSFAVFGDGVTLNGVTYPVQDRSITIGAYNFQLNGLAVVYNSDNTMTVENDKISASLGEIVDNTITFNGIWYFTARALNGFYTNVPTVEWDIGTWATTFNQTIVLYEAILLIGGLVARHYQKIKALDWVIIIFAMVGGAVLV